jgi:hypothetical protein
MFKIAINNKSTKEEKKERYKKTLVTTAYISISPA